MNPASQSNETKVFLSKQRLMHFIPASQSNETKAREAVSNHEKKQTKCLKSALTFPQQTKAEEKEERGRPTATEKKCAL